VPSSSGQAVLLVLQTQYQGGAIACPCDASRAVRFETARVAVFATKVRSGAARPRFGYRAGSWAAAYAFLAAIAFTTAPTALWTLYAARDDLTALLVTTAFAVYAVGVIASLFVTGSLSDTYGRRRVMLPALGLEVLAAIVLLVWPAYAGLLLGRVLTGFGAGALIAVASAWIGELRQAARPGEPARRSELITSAVNLGGLGLGAFAGGALAEWASDPLTLPYAVCLVALTLAGVLVWATPETQVAVHGPRRYRPHGVVVPASARRRFVAAAGAATIAFAAFGLFAAVAPDILAVMLHHPSHALAGATALAVFGSAVVAEIALKRTRLHTVLLVGSCALPTGLAVVVVSVWLASPSLALFLIGGAVVGVGSGLLFKGAVATALAVAEPGRRAETLAGVYVAGYTGLVIPVMALGLLTDLVDHRAALLIFSVVLAVGTVASAPALVGRRAR
jgi:MFS family permease